MPEVLDKRRPRWSMDWLLISLAVAALIATGFLIYLLNFPNLGMGYLVVVSGLGGIIGTSLSPLLAQRSGDSVEGRTGVGIPSRIFTLWLIYVVGGFGFATVAFIVTSSLLMTEPGYATSALGTVAFGGIVGFYLGREINRMGRPGTSDETTPYPAVVSALGEIEDRLLGPALLSYDGYVVAGWQASRASSETVGRLLVYMVAREYHEQEGYEADFDSEAETKRLSLPDLGRVVIQGGRDAELVPFAISVITGTLDVQPLRLILAAPSEGKSEALGFTLLAPRLEKESGSIQTLEGERPDAEAENVMVLIDVSQAGRTVQLFEVEIPFP